MAARFAVIVGASGSGKSSLARAGVAAFLTRHSFEDNVREWRTVVFIPGLAGGDLCTSVLRAIAEQLPELRSSATALDDIASGLLKEPELTVKLSVMSAFTRAAEHGSGAIKVLLLLDQMEELWTDRRYGDKDRDQFLEAMEALARSGHISVLATLRSDFYPQAQRNPTFLRLKGERGHFDLLPPGAAALQRLITEPARLAGLRFECDERTGKTLDEVILQDASHDPSALPLLQYALTELYLQRDESTRTLTFATYEKLGGVEGALGRRAADTFNGLFDAARMALPEILPLLVTIDVVGEQTPVRRRALLTELTGTPARQLLTESLIAARFLTTDHQDDGGIASLAHEALLRRWKHLATWVAANSEYLRLRARVEQNQQRWEQQSRDSSLLLPPGLPLEEGRQLLTAAPALLSRETDSYIRSSMTHHDLEQSRTRQRRRIILVTMSFLTVLALTGGVVAWVKQREAVQQRNFAIANEEKAKKNEARAITGEQVAEREKNEKSKLADQEKAARLAADTNARKALSEAERADAAAKRTAQANERNRILLHRASMADFASGRYILQEDFDARQDGRYAVGIGGAPKWHEAAAYFVRALELENKNWLAAVWLHNVLQNHSDEKRERAVHILQEGNRGVIVSASFNFDGTKVVTTSSLGNAGIWDASTGQPIGESLRHDNEITTATFNADGTKVVTAGNGFCPQIWDAATGQPIGEPLAYDTYVGCAEFSPDGTKVVTASADDTARIWDVATGQPIGELLRHEEEVNTASFSPDGTKVVTASLDQTARIWDVATGQPIGEPLCHDAGVGCAEFSPDGTKVVTASADDTARIWDAATGQQIGEPLRHEAPVACAKFSPDGTLVVTASADKTARIWDAATGRSRTMPLRHQSGITDASFSPDGSKIVTASFDSTAQIWNTNTGKPIGDPMRIEGVGYSADFSPDGFKVVISSSGTAQIWNVLIRQPLGEPLRHGDDVDSAEFSPDGTMIVTASDKTAQIWDAATGQRLGEPLRHEEFVTNAGFSPDGAKIATVTWDNTAQIWDSSTGQPLSEPLRQEFQIDIQIDTMESGSDGSKINIRKTREIRLDKTATVWDRTAVQSRKEALQHNGDVNSASLSPDGRRIVTASDDKTAQIWNAATGLPIGEPLRHESPVNDAGFSADGSRVITASDDKTAQVWNATTGRPIGEPLRHEGPVKVASFSPDGTKLVSICSYDVYSSVQVWDPATGLPIREPNLHPYDGDLTATFSPDSSKLATTSRFFLRVCDVATGQPLGEPLLHTASIHRASFSPDGSRVVTSCSDGTARVWELPTPAEYQEIAAVTPAVLDWARALAGHEFNDDGELQIIPLPERQAALATPELPPGPWTELEQWLKSSGVNRRLSPGSTRTLREIAERERDFGTRASLDSAWRYDSTVPLTLLLAAELLEKENEALPEDLRDLSISDRLAFFRRYDLDRLPQDAGLWVRAAQILYKHPAARVGVGPASATALDEALKAARKSVKLAPELPAAKETLNQIESDSEKSGRKLD